uniref:Uncharacterized protein n=1 Tax=Romanomermis culicivorax TaxID=13658 RepID=A0A915L925_ROMCU
MWCYQCQRHCGYWGPMFNANGTIHDTLVDKIQLNGEPSLLAVDAICCAVEQGSHNAQPAAAVAMLPSTMTTGAQTLAVIAQQQPVAAVKLPPSVANAFGETLHAINDDVSIIEALPFQMATAPWSPKIGVLRKVHPCGGLVINFPREELISSGDDDEE